MPKEFKPSSHSGSPASQSVQSLQYLCRAAKALEVRIGKQKEDEVPLWVQSKIREAGMSLGMAVSYFDTVKEKK